MLAYTFRTYPYIEQLQQIFPEVFIFGELKSDFAKLAARLEKGDIIEIIGVANTQQESRIEPIAFNQFNRGKVEKNGPEKLELFIHRGLKGDFAIAPTPTSTFCNWTMYKLQNIIERGNMQTQLSFIHLNYKDLYKLRRFAEQNGRV